LATPSLPSTHTLIAARLHLQALWVICTGNAWLWVYALHGNGGLEQDGVLLIHILMYVVLDGAIILCVTAPGP